MPSFDKYKTAPGSNAGQRLLLLDVDGKPTEDWIHVLGIDSDKFRQANLVMRRNLMTYMEENGGPEKAQEMAGYQELADLEGLKLTTSLVHSWSFEEPCTPENVLDLFTGAPDVAKQVDRFASKRSRFVGKLQTASEPSPSIKSASPSPRPKTQPSVAD